MGTTVSKERREFILRYSILDRPRKFVVDPEYLEFDDRDLVGELPTHFDRNTIEALRYGVKGIRGYRFRIGRIYCIEVRDKTGRVIKVRLRSVYRIRRKLLGEKFQAITNALFQCYFHDVARSFLHQFREGQPIEILGVSLSHEGVLFDRQVGRVSWNFIGTKRFWHYYTLFSEEDPTRYRAFVFLDDWNAGVLRGVIESILKEKFPNR